jgi:hypothetical protein
MANEDSIDDPNAVAKEAIGVIWADFAARTVHVEFNETFYKKPLDEQASVASALLEAALNEHVDAQDARVDALTPAIEAASPPAAFFDAEGAAAAASDL